MQEALIGGAAYDSECCGRCDRVRTVKKLADLGDANGNRPLTYESYVALLLEACLTFDKKHELSGRQKRAVYMTGIPKNDLEYPYDPVDDGVYEAYWVDTDISEIMAHASESHRFGNRSGTRNPRSKHIPYPDWIAMS
jgi:hypothetical protein